MGQDQLGKIIEELVTDCFADNIEFVSQELANGLDWDEDFEITLSKSMVKAVRVSTRMAVQITISLLVDLGVLRIQPDDSSPKLEIIQGGKDSEPTD